MRMSRDHHGCGIVTDAVYAIVDVDEDDAHSNVLHETHDAAAEQLAQQ